MLSISCNRQEKNKISDIDIKKLFEQEKRNEERAKYGNQEFEITTISNPKEVEKIRLYILENNEKKKANELEKLKDKTLTERYKDGDKSVVPEIIKVLKGDDFKARKEIYRNFSRFYDEPENYNISEGELIEVILDNISIETDEKSVIQLAGFMNLPGYAEVFENHLLSKNSKDINRLIFWLGKDGTSKKTLDYIENLILNTKFDFDENDYVMSGLKGFSENGDSTSKENVLEICLEIYNKKLIPKERFDELKTSWSSTNPAISLIEILLESNDTRIISIAYDFLKNEISEQKALFALIRLEGEKHKPLIYEFLRDKDKFFDGLNPAIHMYKLTKDNQLVETILIQFEKRKEQHPYEIEMIVSTLVSMNATHYFDDLDKILKNKELIKSIRDSYELSKGTVETIAKDLYEMGVVDKAFSQSVIEKAKQAESEYDGSIGYVYNFLTVSGIYQWFDAETDFVPVDYDNLIRDFSKNSNGRLSEIEVWMDADVDDDYNVIYKIYVNANKRIYIIEPDDIGDWYDVDMTLKLMNTILSDSNITERFVFIDTGDQTVQIIFGPKEKVKLFAKKYKL